MLRTGTKLMIFGLLLTCMAFGYAMFNDCDNSDAQEVIRGYTGDTFYMVEVDSSGNYSLTLAGEGYTMDDYSATNPAPWSAYPIKDVLALSTHLQKIGDYSFYHMTSLETVAVPDRDLVTIGKRAFDGCTALTTLSASEQPLTIQDYAFYRCTNLTTLEDVVVKDPGISAFANCTKITSVKFSNSTTVIGEYAFQNCTNLNLTSLPSGLTTIDKYTFSRCTNLALTSLPDGVTEIKDSAFLDCSKLALTELPDGLTTIGSSAFMNCSILALTELPSSVTVIDTYAFSGCSKLALTSLPSGITGINGGAFQDCKSLTQFELPSKIRYVGPYAFSGCTKLTLAGVPEGTTIIGEAAFLGCSKLAEFTIPSTVTVIEDNAFYRCYDLKIIYNDSNLDIGFDTDYGAVGNYADKIYTKSLAIQETETKVDKEGSAYTLLHVVPIFVILGVLMLIVAYLKPLGNRNEEYVDIDMDD